MAALLPQSGPRTALVFDARARELLAPRRASPLVRGGYRFSWAARTLTVEYLPAPQKTEARPQSRFRPKGGPLFFTFYPTGSPSRLGACSVSLGTGREK